MTNQSGQPDARRRYDVPAGTLPSTCKGHTKPGGSCSAAVYWVEVPRAKGPGLARIPVDVAVVGGRAPDAKTPGSGVSHFTTCPDRDKF